MTETKLKQTVLGNFAVLIAATLWGTTGTAATFAPEVSAVAIGAVAMGGGGLLQALTAMGQIYHFKQKLCQYWRYLLAGALAVAIYPLAFYAAMRLAGVTIGTVVSIGSAPLLSVLLEYYLDNLRLSLRWLVAALLGLTGIILLCLPHSTTTYTTFNIIAGILLALIAGLTYAIYSWTARKLMLKQIPSRAAMGATFGLGGLLLIPVLFMTGAPLLMTWNNAAVGLYMALIPMLIGYLCYGYGLARITASSATTITLFEPVVATALAILIVGERLLWQGWLGIVMIIACLICITLPFKAYSCPSSSPGEA